MVTSGESRRGVPGWSAYESYEKGKFGCLIDRARRRDRRLAPPMQVR